MSLHENSLGVIHPRRQIGRAPLIGMKLLDQDAMGVADSLRARAWRKAQDLIGLVLGHPAAALPAIATPAPEAPAVRIRLHVLTPGGKPPSRYFSMTVSATGSSRESSRSRGMNSSC